MSDEDKKCSYKALKKGRYVSKTINGVKQRLHRHVMESKLGRKLESYEHVYHINGNKQDNSIENLIIIIKEKKSSQRIPMPNFLENYE